MDLYFVSTKGYLHDILVKNNVKKILLSYFYVSSLAKWVKSVNDWSDKFILDSGAFSAFTLRKKVNMDKYIKFINFVKPKNYIVLDVIGSAEKTLENLKYMESKGLKPMPVFHIFKHANTDNLKRIISNKRYDYIGIGINRSIKMNKPLAVKFLNEIWTIIKYERPELKVHGLGITSELLTKYFPWYSIDSTTWVNPQRFGASFKKGSMSRHVNKDLLQHFGYKTMKELHKNVTKETCNRYILSFSIKHFLDLEAEVTHLHDNNILKFENLKQLSLF